MEARCRDPIRAALQFSGPDRSAWRRRFSAGTLGFPVTIFERGHVGDAMRRWGHIRLFSPFGMNITPRGRASLGKAALPADTACITGNEHVAAYLEPLSKCDALHDCLELETTVVSIGRGSFDKSDSDPRRGQVPFRLLVSHLNKERIEEAEIVFDCTGTYGNHRWLGEGGIPAPGEPRPNRRSRMSPTTCLGPSAAITRGKASF